LDRWEAVYIGICPHANGCRRTTPPNSVRLSIKPEFSPLRILAPWWRFMAAQPSPGQLADMLLVEKRLELLLQRMRRLPHIGSSQPVRHTNKRRQVLQRSFGGVLPHTMEEKRRVERWSSCDRRLLRTKHEKALVFLSQLFAGPKSQKYGKQTPVPQLSILWCTDHADLVDAHSRSRS